MFSRGPSIWLSSSSAPPKNMTNATFLPWSFGIWFHLEGLFLIACAVQRHSSINSLNDPAVPCCVIFSFGPLAMCRRGQCSAPCCWFIPGRKSSDHITTWVFSLKQEHHHHVYLHINIRLQCMDRWLKTGRWVGGVMPFSSPFWGY